MDAFPAFIPLAGRRVVVVGEGETADNKARLFDGSPARLDRLSLDQAQTPGALEGAALVFVAGPDEPARAVAALARAAGALVNVVDAPALGDFTTPSIVDRGRVVGAVGTDGSAPVLAVRLRQEIEALWPVSLGALARVIGEMRAPAKAAFPQMGQRRRWLRALTAGPVADLALAGREAEALVAARALLAHPEAPQGWVQVMAAPDEPDALTLGQARRLGEADTVVLAGDVAPALLSLARRDAQRLAWSNPSATALKARAAEGETTIVLCAPAFFDEVRQALEG